MESVTDRLNKLREERIAREKARIEKLRELNLKKYNKNDTQPKNSVSNGSVAGKSIKNETGSNITKNNVNSNYKNNFHVNGVITKRPLTAPEARKSLMPKKDDNGKSNIANDPKIETKIEKNFKKPDVSNNRTGSKIPMMGTSKLASHQVTKDEKKLNAPKIEVKHTRKSLAAPKLSNPKPTMTATRKTMIPKMSDTNTRESVFDRLYKPKVIANHDNDINKLKTDPNYLKKVIKSSGLLLEKSHAAVKTKPPVRRSISAVHFKRISKNEIGNCIHKWASIGDKLNNVHLKHINEDETVNADKVISAIKSERKKVKFMTPIPQNFNTPRPEELQARLKSWLQKRGKSLDTYHHLQCFGINHLSNKDIVPLAFEELAQFNYEEENKENIALNSDSDDDSYVENMNENNKHVKDTVNWRRASCVSESVDFNESADSTLTSTDVFKIDEILLGALNDLTDLLKEGFDWEQSARWLRAIRERFPDASNTAAYWECRAALEERRGDLPASVQCWEEAIAKGTEHSVVEANLDQLLDKFMQLKISPNSGKRRCIDPKMVDVKNVFKSTIIRFAVQQAKLRRSEGPKYTVTPVRRSGRLSVRTPLAECSSVRTLAPGHAFVPNPTICQTP